MTSTDRQDAAFNTAAAVVTCLVNGDRLGAQGFAHDCELLEADVILVLAGALAAGHTPESWRDAIAAAHRAALEEGQ